MPIRRLIRHLSLVAALALSAAGPASAAVSDWVETEGGRLRIIALPAEADGTVRAVLDIALSPGWKTYWRDPGESGIPPTIDIGRSENLQSLDILFPAPERVDDGYSIWAGYTRPVMLPLVLAKQGDGPAHLKAEIFLGICEKVCIPVQAEIDLPLAEDVTPLHRALVEQAFADLPETEAEGFSVELASAKDETLELVVHLPQTPGTAAPLPDLFVAGPLGWHFGVPVPSPHEGAATTFTVPIEGSPENAGADAAPITVVVKTLTRSFEAIVPLP